MFKMLKMIVFCVMAMGITVSHGSEDQEKKNLSGSEISDPSLPKVSQRMTSSHKKRVPLQIETEKFSDKEPLKELKHRKKASLIEEADEFSDIEIIKDTKMQRKQKGTLLDISTSSQSYDPFLHTIHEMQDKIEKLSIDNNVLRKQVINMEKNIGAMTGNQKPYYRFMRADLVIQLTLIFTMGYTFLTIATGGSFSDTAMAILSMYMFYGFFKCVRDVGSYAGNLNLKRPD